MLMILFSSILLFFIYSSTYFWSSSIIFLLLMTFISLTMLFSPYISFSYSSSLFLIDQMSSSLITLSFWISALMLISSYKVFQTHNNSLNFSLYIIVLSFILILAFSVNNLIAFYIMFEASLIPTFLLIMGWGYQPERLQATFYLVLYTITASLPLLLSLSWLFMKTGSLYIFPTFTKLMFTQFYLSSYLWWSITILAFMVKMPMYTVHLWLPKAHVEAPVAGSMILAGILLKLGGYGFLRLSYLFHNLSFKVAPLFSSLAMWGGVITSFICLRQSDIKSLIAYSSIGHMALVILSASMLSSWGWQGALSMMIAHGLCSSCMFALANMTYDSMSTRSLYLTKGILSLAPAFSMWWFLLSICNMAAPPSINLFAEISIFIASLWTSWTIIIPLALCSFLACAYSLYLFTATNHGSISSFSNPMNFSSTVYYVSIFLHFLPIWAMILKPELISIWI